MRIVLVLLSIIYMSYVLAKHREFHRENKWTMLYVIPIVWLWLLGILYMVGEIMKS